MSESFDPYFKWLSIPAEEQPPNHYRLLGIPEFTPDADVIENAANRQESHVRQYRSGEHGSLAEKLLKEITAARHCLLGPEEKAAYDAELKNTMPAARPASPKSAPATAAARRAAPREPAAPNVPFTPTTTSGVRQRQRKKSAWGQIALITGIAAVLPLLALGAYTMFVPETPPDVADKGTDRAASDAVVEPPPKPDPSPAPEIKEADDAAGTTTGVPPTPPQQADQPGAEVDLLRIIDPARDAVTGNWGMADGVLTSPRAHARLQVPYTPPKEYDLTAVVTRVEGGDALVIGLLVGEYRVAVLLDGWRGSRSGLDSIDRRRPDNNETTYRGSVLPSQTATTITCSVRDSHVVVRCDDQTIVDWQGAPARLAPFGIWNVPDDNCLMLACYHSKFEISKLVLTPVSGAGQTIDGDWRSRLPYASHVLAVIDDAQKIVDTYDAPAYAERTFEAERDFKHNTGEHEEDGHSATPGTHRHAAMMYGPFVRDIPGGGPHNLKFRMMAGKRRGRIVTLDVYDPGTRKILMQQEVLGGQFDQAMAYQDIAASFLCQGNRRLEFRVFFNGNSYVRVDRVSLAPAPVVATGPWQLKLYRMPQVPSTSGLSPEQWTEITSAEPFAEREVSHLAFFWQNQLRTSSWFAAVATANVQLPAGKYEFRTLSDDGVRVYLDGERVIDHWTFHPPRVRTAEIDVTEGEHGLRVEYFQGASYGQLQFWLRPIAPSE